LAATQQERNENSDAIRGPATPWLGAGLLLAGLGTVLLGPILPLIELRWHLSDQQTGPLFFVKFVGSFLGGITVPRKLRSGILIGTLLACAGFAAFAFAGSLLPGCIALLIAGYGLGQIIASTNILAGHRYTRRTGSALSTLNFFFSLGAVLTGILVAALAPRTGLRDFLFLIATVFAATGLAGHLQTFKRVNKRSASIADPILPAAFAEDTPERLRFLSRNILLLFALFLFLYGGLETCLAGWITTFGTRYVGAHFLGGQSALVLLLAALTVGRALASFALRYTSERAVQRTGLLATALFIPALALSGNAGSLAVCSVLLGLALAPVFPTTFALLMHRSPSPREAGFILAVSGLGAAIFPWVLGIVSTRTGSLRVAMAVPAVLSLLLLTVSFAPELRRDRETLHAQ
jgi:FHS family glucose/mannose:H+ symporter-like MFS transporter